MARSMCLPSAIRSSGASSCQTKYRLDFIRPPWLTQSVTAVWAAMMHSYHVILGTLL
nr:MAG TPA: hypothetical protein [Bacteriophage sp.]